MATQSLIAAGASRSAVGASKAREMGLVWGWGAVCILATYALGVASWKEWWHFLIPFAVLSVACLWFARTLGRDAANGVNDEGMLKLSRNLAIGQLVGMIVTMVGLVIDGKMTRFIAPRKGWEDWPANNYFFFGALALAILSIHAIRAQSKAGTTTQAAKA
jgi:phosphatidylglycerophosphate synthase